MKMMAVIGVFLVKFTGVLCAGSINVSFVDEDVAINQTEQFLLAQGCSKESVSSFHRVISWYNSTPSDLDLSKFPPKKDGFYRFNSVSNLTAKLKCRLTEVNHQPELNCYDTTFLLANSLMKFKRGADDVIGPFIGLGLERLVALLTHGFIDEQTDAFGEAAGAFFIEQLQNRVQEFRIAGVGHVVMDVGCVC
jgi:hypothetical protein